MWQILISILGMSDLGIAWKVSRWDQQLCNVDEGVANREFFYILREMTKLQIYGCGGAPAGGWSGIWDM